MKRCSIVKGLKIISIKNATETEVVKIQIEWHAKQCAAQHNFVGNPQRETWKSSAYTDFNNSSL